MKTPKIAKYTSEEDVTVFFNTLKNAARIVQMKSKFKVVMEDPDDDAVLQAAYDSKANYIISGDKHLLALKQFKGIRIVTVDEMLNALNN